MKSRYTRNLETLEEPTNKVVGVKVVEVIDGANVDSMKTLKYDLPNVDEYDIGAKIIPGDFGDTDNDNFTTSLAKL